jgi:preprotein translocase subunit SecE
LLPFTHIPGRGFLIVLVNGKFKYMDTKTQIQKFSPIIFIKEVKSELIKVSWPTRSETIKLTSVVIAISVIVALFIGVFDALFLKLSTLFWR